MTQSCASLWIPLFLPMSAQDSEPEALVKKITEEVLAALKSDKQLAAGDREKAVKLAEEKILPHVDFEEATRLAVGRGWSQASPEQRKNADRRVPQHAGAHLLERHRHATRARP